MRIHQLEKSKWLKDKQIRKWRWNATGTGNYSSRGRKGQKSRSWSSRKPFFEGGQTSIVQRLPKARGFKRYFKLVKKFTILNLGVLDSDIRITDTMEITKAVLKELWYIKSIKDNVKILAQGDYAKKLTFVDMNAISVAAQKKIDNPWTAHSIAKKAPIKVVKVVKDKKPVKKVVAKKAPIKKIIEKKVVEKKIVKENKKSIKKNK